MIQNIVNEEIKLPLDIILAKQSMEKINEMLKYNRFINNTSYKGVLYEQKDFEKKYR